VLVGQPQDLAGKGEVFERGRSGGLRQVAGRSMIICEEAWIVRIVGRIRRPVAEAALRRHTELINAVIEDCSPQTSVLRRIGEVAAKPVSRDAAEPAADSAPGGQLEGQDRMRDHGPGSAQLASPAPDLALPPGVEARIGVGAIASPPVQRPAFGHLTLIVVPRLGHGPARLLLGKSEAQVVGVKEGQRLARVNRYAIGLGDEVGRLGFFLELVAKPWIGDIALEEALGVRQGADLVRITPIENLAVSLGGHVRGRGGPTRVRHLSAPIAAAVAAVSSTPIAASGHAAAPPSSVMKSRRCMSSPKLRRRHPNASNECFDRG
jgi:hypothetical protein